MKEVTLINEFLKNNVVIICCNYLGHMYLAEALVACDKITDAVEQLKPDNLQDDSTGDGDQSGARRVADVSLNIYLCILISVGRIRVYTYMLSISEFRFLCAKCSKFRNL